jgi:hypothetical protein
MSRIAAVSSARMAMAMAACLTAAPTWQAPAVVAAAARISATVVVAEATAARIVAETVAEMVEAAAAAAVAAATDPIINVIRLRTPLTLCVQMPILDLHSFPAG